ncbi:MAG: class I SAM-dependent methyltransferase [Ignavibacteriales bacterium]|nr:class I SAM-dependent methyltransferase [Ignavibacteriales bacterium]
MTDIESAGCFKIFVNRFVIEHAVAFRGKHVVDMPAGTGVTSRTLRDVGARVSAFDLFPEYFKVDGIRCQRADILEGIPLTSGTADAVICQEGIEHFSDQLKAFREFNRILTPAGKLYLTTPNYSNLRAKLSHLLAETERFGSMMPPNEIDSVWMVNTSVSKEFYLGHVFLIGIQKLRVLAKLSGLKINNIYFEQVKPTSLLLFPVFYPFILLFNWLAYRKNMRKKSSVPAEKKKEVYGEQLRLNINPKILVDGTLFVEFTKECEFDSVADKLRSVHDSFDIRT